jgi:hypothetical protein
MASSKFNSQVSALSYTGLNPGVAQGAGQQKSKEPNVPSPVHNRGLTLGGKQHLTTGGNSQTKAIHANESAPKAPAHPAVAKNPGGKPSISFG